MRKKAEMLSVIKCLKEVQQTDESVIVADKNATLNTAATTDD